MKILLVDHDENFGAVCAAALEKHGFSVDRVTCGLSALEILNDNAYDLVIAELGLPYLRGTDLYLRAVGRWPALEGRFLYMGCSEPEDMREQNIIKGRFMIKPFAMGSFVEYVMNTVKAQRPFTSSRMRGPGSSSQESVD